MLPANVDTPRGRHLQELARRASQSGWSDWPMLSHNDYVLVGAIVVLYSHMDVNLRRIVELADDNNMLRPPWKGKTAKLTMTDIERAVMSLDWSAENLGALEMIAKRRGLRNSRSQGTRAVRPPRDRPREFPPSPPPDRRAA